MVEAISYRNELVVVINEIIATKILLQYMIFIAMTFCCENLLPQSLLQRLATTNFRCDKSLLQQKIWLQLTFFLVVMVFI